MPDANTTRVIGKDGLRGVLLGGPSAAGGDEPVRIRLDNGEIIELPASMVRRHSPGTIEIPIGVMDLERYENTTRGLTTETVLPVLAEELNVTKRAVPTGGIRVHRRVHEHDEAIDVPLLKEQVDVRRVLIDREVDGPLPVRREGETTIIPIVEEVLVVSKRLVLKEEVHVTRIVREERHTETVTLKREESEIERVDASGRPLPLSVPLEGAPAEERPTRARRRPLSPRG
jgi:uncharacterized protein (TIGR02271 family)